MIKFMPFYCQECGKEMWQNVNWDNISHLTLKQVKDSLICSDCILKKIKDEQYKQCIKSKIEDITIKMKARVKKYPWDASNSMDPKYIEGLAREECIKQSERNIFKS